MTSFLAALRSRSLVGRVGLTFALIFCVFVAVGVLLWHATGLLSDALEEEAEHEDPLVASAYQMAISALGSGKSVREYLDRPSPLHRARRDQYDAEFQRNLDIFRSLAETEQERSLGYRAAVIYKSYASLGLHLMSTQDRLAKLYDDLTLALERAEHALYAVTDEHNSGATHLLGDHAIFFAALKLQVDVSRALAVVAMETTPHAASGEESRVALFEELHEHYEDLATTIKQSEDVPPTILALRDTLQSTVDGTNRAHDLKQRISGHLLDLDQYNGRISAILTTELAQVIEQTESSSDAEADEALQSTYVMLLVLGAFILLIGPLLTFLFARAIMRPVRDLAVYTEAIGEGRFDRPRLPRSSAEFEHLGTKLSEMAGTLKHAHEALREANVNLERQVAERTSELRSTNHRLELELEQRRAIERDLRVASQQAQAANRAKSTFLATMSHELRTPLNAVLGFSEILKEQLFGSLGNEKYLGYASDIHGAGTHLLQVINDILDVSRIELGEMRLDDKTVDPNRLLDSVATMIGWRAKRQGVAFAIDYPADLPQVRGDPVRLKQVLINLVDNAIKFTPKGGTVTLGARVTEAAELELSVTDSGIGMAPAHLETAFELFGQVDNGLERRAEGVGLGLPLARRLTELHGGRLDVRSTLGEGTCATVTLPATDNHAGRADTAAAPRTKPSLIARSS